MTTEVKAPESIPRPPHSVLLVKDGNVVLSHNYSDTGPATSILAGLLLNNEIQHAYVAGVRLYDGIFAQLNREMQHVVPGWRMRITNRRRHAYLSNGVTRVAGRFFVDYIAIARKASDGAMNASRRLPLKKLEVINLDLLKEQPPPFAEEQMEVALALLDLCDQRGIRMRSTRGGIGSALLKASPFWVPGRKPAPRFINQKTRSHLPGNFYSISQRVEQSEGISPIPHCYYLDQSNAHHTIASTVPLPHPEAVHARGYWGMESGLWARPSSPIGKQILEGCHIGVVLCQIHVSSLAPTQSHLYPPWAAKRGTKTVWLWTPELRLFDAEKHRLQLDHFVAAYTASQTDPCLREYSEWALSEIDRDPTGSVHKKGALLAAYGMLAFNHEKHNVIYRYWGDGQPGDRVEVPGAGLVREKRVRIPQAYQPSIVNVLARGLIESETRTRALEYAKQLANLGYHIPQIYADGFLVESRSPKRKDRAGIDQLPFVADGWRVAYSLTNVRIPRPNALISDQITKLPGVMGSEEDREWERRRDDAHHPYPVILSTPETEKIKQKAARILARSL